MLVAINARELTAEQHEELGRKAGWRLVKVWKTGGAETERRRHVQALRAPLEA
jgi:hypothetical protein